MSQTGVAREDTKRRESEDSRPTSRRGVITAWLARKTRRCAGKRGLHCIAQNRLLPLRRFAGGHARDARLLDRRFCAKTPRMAERRARAWPASERATCGTGLCAVLRRSTGRGRTKGSRSQECKTRGRRWLTYFAHSARVCSDGRAESRLEREGQESPEAFVRNLLRCARNRICAVHSPAKLISRRTGVWVLVAFTIAVVAATLLVHRISQPQSYHDFAKRTPMQRP
jgi:hypothetical protein